MSLQGKRVLLTGNTGFIGSHLGRRLSALGADLYIAPHSQFHDLERGAMWIHLKPEIVFHCAGKTSGAGVVKHNPFALVNPNLIMTAHALAAAHDAGARAFIFPSSTTGYPPYAHPMREDEFHGALFEGYRTIGTVKRFLEQLAALYPMTTVALRISNAFGPGDQFDPVKAHVIAATVRKVAERHDPVRVWGDGSEIRDALYIDDVVDAMILAAEWSLEQPAGTHEAFNIGRGVGHSVYEILSQLLVLEDHHPAVEFDTTKPTLLPTRLVDVSKAREVLGFEAKVGMTDGLSRTLRWFKAQTGGAL